MNLLEPEASQNKILLWVNGGKHELNPGTTLGMLLQGLSISKQDAGVAVALNSEVIPKNQWERITLEPGINIEIVHAVAGG